jgi:hypothetical protein
MRHHMKVRIFKLTLTDGADGQDKRGRLRLLATFDGLNEPLEKPMSIASSNIMDKPPASH